MPEESPIVGTFALHGKSLLSSFLVFGTQQRQEGNMFGMSKAPRPPKRKASPPGAEATNPFAPPVPDDVKTKVTVSLTHAQHVKLKALGGAKWIAAQIEKARPGDG